MNNCTRNCTEGRECTCGKLSPGDAAVMAAVVTLVALLSLAVVCGLAGFIYYFYGDQIAGLFF